MRAPIFPIPNALRAELQQKAKDLDVLSEAGKIPHYEEFVDRLFKPIETNNQTLLHAVVGISGEAGELLDQVKKVWAYNKPIDHENMVEELADTFFYLVAALNLMGLSVNDLVAHNMTKLMKRYPDGYSDQAAQARADKQEPEPDRSRDHIGAEK